MLIGTFRTAFFAALVMLAVLAGLYSISFTWNVPAAGPGGPAAAESGDRITLALVEHDTGQLLSIRPAFLFFSSGKAIFLDGGIRSNSNSAGVPKYSTVSNIDRAALMRDLGTYATFAKFRGEYVISEPEDPQGMIFMICEVGECKKIKIIGNPVTCRRRGSACNLSAMPAELSRAVEYLSDFVHPDSENYPLAKVEVIFTPKSKDEVNSSFGRTTRGLPIPLVEWPPDWPPLSAAGADGKFRILLDTDKYPRLLELVKGLRVEDFGVIREGLLSINGKTGLPSVAIPLPGLETWQKN